MQFKRGNFPRWLKQTIIFPVLQFKNVWTSQEKLKQTMIFPVFQFKCGNFLTVTETDHDFPNFKIWIREPSKVTEKDHDFPNFTI